MKNPCYLCEIETNGYIEIFGAVGKELEIASVISQHFWFQVEEANEVNDTTKVICHQCWTHLAAFHRFYTNIEKRHKGSEFNNLVKVEENEDCVDNLNPFTQNHLEVSVDLEKIHKRSEFQNIVKVEENRNESEVRNEDNQESRLLSDNKTIKIGIRSERDAYLRTFFHMDCDICEAECLNLSEARRHYKNVHNLTGYVTCCSKKFYNLPPMRRHIALHVNPKALVCDFCSKGFGHKALLRAHVRSHIKPENRPIKCGQCTKTFLTVYRLNIHQTVKHSNNVEKKFECDQCGKRFVLNYLLVNHKIQVHAAKKTYVCDVCAKVFAAYANYLEHKKHIHGDPIPRVQCNVCGAWLKPYNLKKHLNSHNDSKRKCEICFRILKNKRSLQSHMHEIHSGSKPLFVCKVCGKEYRKALKLQDHMASHTGAILYSCSFCPKTFNSSSNMYRHRKVLHPKEYQESKEEYNPRCILKSSTLIHDL